jgi:hypothetical protein
MLVILPEVWIQWQGIYHHYIEHVKIGENVMRQQEMGIHSTADRLLYYPRSILQDHLGKTWFRLAIAAVAGAGVVGMLRYRRPTRREAVAPPPDAHVPGWLGCTLLCALWPVVVLTAYPSPSPVVGSVVVAPLVLSAALLALLFVQRSPKSDLVVLTTRPFPRVETIYPFNCCMAKLRPRLIAYCEQELLTLGAFRFFGGEVTVYSRPTLTINGDSAGWVTSAGLSLQGSTDALRIRPVVELRGPNNSVRYGGRLPQVHATLLLPNHSPRPVSATLTAVGEEYRLVLRFPRNLPPHAPAEVRLTFDAYFVPKQLGLNEDMRELVIETPTLVTCRRPQETTARR